MTTMPLLLSGESQIDILSPGLQAIADHVLDAGQRAGQATLDAAYWIYVARQQATPGEWQPFLRAITMSEDAAERLIHIHVLSCQDKRFADAIRSNLFGQSVAALIARPSVPPAAREALLGLPGAPTVAQARDIIRQHQLEGLRNVADATSPKRLRNVAESGQHNASDDALAQVDPALSNIQEAIAPPADDATTEVAQIGSPPRASRAAPPLAAPVTTGDTADQWRQLEQRSAMLIATRKALVEEASRHLGFSHSEKYALQGISFPALILRLAAGEIVRVHLWGVDDNRASVVLTLALADSGFDRLALFAHGYYAIACLSDAARTVVVIGSDASHADRQQLIAALVEDIAALRRQMVW